MSDDRGFEELAAKLARVVPTGLRGLREELESNFRALLQANMARLDLVSREHFETQAALLARTQKKLATLEKRLQTLEAAATKSMAANDGHAAS